MPFSRRSMPMLMRLCKAVAPLALAAALVPSAPWSVSAAPAVPRVVEVPSRPAFVKPPGAMERPALPGQVLAPRTLLRTQLPGRLQVQLANGRSFRLGVMPLHAWAPMGWIWSAGRSSPG